MSFLSKLFGGDPQINYKPPGFSSGGLSGSFSGGQYNISQSPALSNQIGSLQATFGREAGAFGGLASTVQPGFSQFRQAGLADIDTSRTSAISNLRDTLAQRRILGSSFGQNSLANAEAEFASKRADFIGQSYLQELQASNQLIQEQYQAATQQFKVGIDQMNLEAGVAAQLTGQVSSAMANVAMAQAKLDADAAAGAGKLIGTVAAIGLAPVTGGASLAAIPAIAGGGGGFGSFANMPGATSYSAWGLPSSGSGSYSTSVGQ